MREANERTTSWIKQSYAISGRARAVRAKYRLAGLNKTCVELFFIIML